VLCIAAGVLTGFLVVLDPRMWPLLVVASCLPLLVKFPEVGLWYVLLDAWLLNSLTFGASSGLLTTTAVAFWFWLVGTLAGLSMGRQQPVVPRNPLNGAVVVFFLVISVSSFTIGTGFSPPLLYNVFFYFAIVFAIQSWAGLERFMAVGAVGCSALVASLVVDWVLNGISGGGLAGFNSNHVQPAIYIVAGLPMLLYCAVRWEGWVRVACAAVLCVGVLSVFASMSRGAVATLVVCAAFVLVTMRGHRGRLVYLLFPLGVALLMLPDRVWQRVQSVEGLPALWGTTASEANSLLSGRGTLYQAAWRMFESSPVFGIGYGMFRQSWAAYADTALTGPAIRSVELSAHSTYLQIMAELGMIGLASYVALLFLSGRNLWRGYRVAAKAGDRIRQVGILCLACSLLAFVVHGTLDNSGWHDRVFFFVLAASTAAATQVVRGAVSRRARMMS
jgi:putative inorganic carbon (hco3(-)) transporter